MISSIPNCIIPEGFEKAEGLKILFKDCPATRVSQIASNVICECRGWVASLNENYQSSRKFEPYTTTAVEIYKPFTWLTGSSSDKIALNKGFHDITFMASALNGKVQNDGHETITDYGCTKFFRNYFGSVNGHSGCSPLIYEKDEAALKKYYKEFFDENAPSSARPFYEGMLKDVVFLGGSALTLTCAYKAARRAYEIFTHQRAMQSKEIGKCALWIAASVLSGISTAKVYNDLMYKGHVSLF